MPEEEALSIINGRHAPSNEDINCMRELLDGDVFNFLLTGQDFIEVKGFVKAEEKKAARVRQQTEMSRFRVKAYVAAARDQTQGGRCGQKAEGVPMNFQLC